MIIDFHTHIFPDKIARKTIEHMAIDNPLKPSTWGSRDELLEHMQMSGVTLSINLPVLTKPEQFQSVMDFALRSNETYYKNHSGILSFGGAHPQSGNYKEELRELKRQGFIGIKLHPDFQKTNFDDIKYKNLVYEASCLGLVTVVHAGLDVGLGEPVHCTPEHSAALIADVRPEKLVLAHLGGWKDWDKVRELIVGKDVYMDLAVVKGFCRDDLATSIMKEHGADKILFGSDSPWTSQTDDIEWVRSLDLSGQEKLLILGENARSLLSL